MFYYSDKYIFDGYLDSLNCLNEAFSKIPESLADTILINQQVNTCLSPRLQEIYFLMQNFNQQVTDRLALQLQELNFNLTRHDSFMSVIEQLQPPLTAHSFIPQECIAAINNLSAIVKPLTNILNTIDFDSLITSTKSEEISDDPEDYIITDSPVIREFNISDNIVIPMGHNRIRMKTGDFICLLSLLFAIFAYLFPKTTNEVLPEPDSQIQDTASSSESNVPSQGDSIFLSQEQSQLLLDILESVDASMSSQVDLLEDIKSTLQEQAEMYHKFYELSQTTPDTAESSPSTVHEASDLIQPMTDNNSESPSINAEND